MFHNPSITSFFTPLTDISPLLHHPPSSDVRPLSDSCLLSSSPPAVKTHSLNHFGGFFLPLHSCSVASHRSLLLTCSPAACQQEKKKRKTLPVALSSLHKNTFSPLTPTFFFSPSNFDSQTATFTQPFTVSEKTNYSQTRTLTKSTNS